MSRTRPVAVIIQPMSPAYQIRNRSALRDMAAGAAGARFGWCGWPEVRREREGEIGAGTCTYLVPEVDIVVEGVRSLLLGAIVGNERGVVEGIKVDAVDFGRHGSVGFDSGRRVSSPGQGT